MKKIMIALGAVALCVSANAASIRWVMAGVTQPESTAAANGYVAYLFASSVSDSLASTYATVSQSDVIAAIADGTFASLTSKAITTSKTGTAGNISVANIGNFGAGDGLTMYSVIFDADSFDAASNYATSATEITRNFTSATGTQIASWASFSSTAGQGWQTMAVPEPTSGLLVLLGMAGLALKRKRA